MDEFLDFSGELGLIPELVLVCFFFLNMRPTPVLSNTEQSNKRSVWIGALSSWFKVHHKHTHSGKHLFTAAVLSGREE